jgi:hypothetical protein
VRQQQIFEQLLTQGEIATEIPAAADTGGIATEILIAADMCGIATEIPTAADAGETAIQ